jgi:hypothetical protein
MPELIINIWQIWASFSMKIPFYRSKSYFSGRNLARLFANKKITGIQVYRGAKTWKSSESIQALKSQRHYTKNALAE